MHLVLIVDDMAVIRLPVAAALQAAGYRTLCAEKGEEALTKARQQTPSLVLLDLTMPGMDGLSVLRALRAMPATATTPVVLLTASGEKDRVLQAAQLGVRDYLLKSGTMMSDVVARVRKYLPPTDAVTPAETVPSGRGSTPAARSAVTAVPTLSREETLRRIDRAEVRLLPRGVLDLIGVVALANGAAVDVSTALQRDPVLFARLLRAANTAVTTTGGDRLSSVPEVVAHFGVDAVQDLITAVGIAGIAGIAAERGGGHGTTSLWQHSLAVATVMRHLSATPPTPAAAVAPGLAYVAGLCHDLPLVLLRQHFPKHHRHAMEVARQGDQPLVGVLAGVFGMPYAELATLLLTKLKLPAALVGPLGEFAAALAEGEPATLRTPLARLLIFADLVAHGLGLGAGLEEPVRPIPRGELAACVLPSAPPLSADQVLCQVARTAALVEETASPAAVGPAAGEPRPVRVLYVRDEEYADLDPLLMMLQRTCQSVVSHTGLSPLPAGLGDADVVLAAAHPETHPAELVSLVHCLRGLPAGDASRRVPVLCASASTSACTGPTGNGVVESRVPLGPQAIARFLDGAVLPTPTYAGASN